jgi:hypothetical protein
MARRDPPNQGEPLRVLGYCTVSDTVVECVRLPLVPVIVSVLVPVGVLERVERVSVEVPEPVTDVGLNVALVREGRLLTLKLTLPLNPLIAVTVTVYEVVPGCPTVRELGEAEIEKLGGFTELTTRVTLVEWLVLPEAPTGQRGVPSVGAIEVHPPELERGLPAQLVPQAGQLARSGYLSIANLHGDTLPEYHQSF